MLRCMLSHTRAVRLAAKTAVAKALTSHQPIGWESGHAAGCGRCRPRAVAGALQKLDLSRCELVTGFAIRNVALRCPRLKVLKLVCCLKLPQTGVLLIRSGMVGGCVSHDRVYK